MTIKQLIPFLLGWMIVSLALSHLSAQPKRQISPQDEYARRLAEAKLAIDKGNAQWCEGWQKADPGMVTAIFAEDGYILSSSGKIIKGRTDIFEAQKKSMQSVDPGVKVTIKTANVWLVDDGNAYETGRYTYEYAEKGKLGKDQGHYATMWKKQKDGAWKLYMDMTVSKD